MDETLLIGLSVHVCIDHTSIFKGYLTTVPGFGLFSIPQRPRGHKDDRGAILWCNQGTEKPQKPPYLTRCMSLCELEERTSNTCFVF
jgi:hypothetical protein